MKKIKELENDGLIMNKAHDYAIDKYRLLAHYAYMFTTGMKSKWKFRVYIDLFAGSGYAKIKETGTIVAASPIIALDVPFKFNKYIFCENNAEYAAALGVRASRDYPDADVTVILKDVNLSVSTILGRVPDSTYNFQVLSLCFVDPYNFKHLEFRTIKALADNLRVDFIILIPSYMDPHRNPEHYIKPGDKRIEKYFGNSQWRESWDAFRVKNKNFGAFFSTEFCKQMGNLGYINPETKRTYVVRRTDNNAPLYDLAFFSKHERGLEFWEKTMKGVISQQTLFD